MDVETQKLHLRKGLQSSPKYIPQWFRYDKHGSGYNDSCLACPYYYLHRAEIDLLQHKGFQAEISEFRNLVDMGSGNSEKTTTIFEYIFTFADILFYFPIDLSAEFISEVCEDLSVRYGNKLVIEPIIAEYKAGLQKIRNTEDPKLIVWFQGLQNLAYDDQVNTLKKLSNVMNDKDIAVVSFDITLKKDVVKRAYLDPCGCGKRFYLNNIWRLNREYGGNIDTDDFAVECDFKVNSSPNTTSCLRVWLRSLKKASYEIPGLNITVDVDENEKIFVHEGEGVSCKYTVDQTKHLGNEADLHVKNVFMNDHAALVLYSKHEPNTTI